MVAKITLLLDNQTGRGFAELQQDFRDSAEEGQDLEKVLSDVEEELDARKAQAYREEVQRLADALDGTAEAARDAEQAAERLASKEERVTALATSVEATIESGRLLKDTFVAARDAIAEFAEQGYEGFQQIDASIRGAESSVKSLLNSLASRPGLQRVVREIAADVEYVSEVFSGMSAGEQELQASRQRNAQVQQSITEALDQSARMAQISQLTNLEKINEELEIQRQIMEETILSEEQSIRAGERILALEERKRELAQNAKAAGEQINNILDRRLKRQDDEIIKQVNSLHEIELRLEKEIELATQLERTEKERADSIEMVAKLEQRRVEIIEERARKEHEAEVQLDRDREEAYQRDLQRQQELQAAEEEATRARVQAMFDAMKAEEEAQKKRFEEFRKQVETIKGGVDQAGTLKKLEGSFGQDDILKKITEQRAREAISQLDKPGVFATDREKAQFRRQQELARRQAFRDTRRDAMRGAIGQDEIGGATRELSRGVINQAIKSGNLSKSQASALAVAAKAAQQNAETTEELQNQVEQIHRQLENVLDASRDTGQRARAQRSSRGR